MKRYINVFLFVICISSSFLLYTENLPAAPKNVFILDAPTANEEKVAIFSIEGYIWQSLYKTGDSVNIGGNKDKFTQYLGQVRNDDTLYIVTHGLAGKFFWNGQQYTGFRKSTDPPNASLMTLPAGFDNLRRIKVVMFACFSKKDPGGGDLPMTTKMYNALGASTTNTVLGFEGKGGVDPDVDNKSRFPARFNQNLKNFSIVQALLWAPFPPANRKISPVADNQKKRLQTAYNDTFGVGNVTVNDIQYKLTKAPNSLLPDSCNCDCDTVCYCVDILSNVCNDCIIDGPGSIITGSTQNYKSLTPEGFWEISNYPPGNAYIVGTNLGDSIFVNAGTSVGHFVLYFVQQPSDSLCGDTLCNFHVYVDNPSPVELTSFISTVTNRNAILNWITSTEQNNSGFDVQRSQNNEWSKIGFVQGHGTTTIPTNYSYEDRNLFSGRYSYRLKQTDFNGNFHFYDLQNDVVIGKPDEFYLSQNFPNPFNPATKINYDIPKDGNVTLRIYDNKGREVKTLVNEFRNAGYYTSEFDGSGLASGTYFYRIESGNFVETRKMIFLK